MQMSGERNKRGDCYEQWLETNDSTCDINDKKSAKAKKKNVFHIALRIKIYLERFNILFKKTMGIVTLLSSRTVRNTFS